MFQKEPALQLISYYDNAIVYLSNGMERNLPPRGWSYELCMDTTISSEVECVAIIFCFVAHDQGWASYPRDDHGQYSSECFLEVRVRRDSMVVNHSRLFNLRCADNRDQVYLCTLRRMHSLVRSLKLGDKICVYARSSYPGWAITVQQGAICVVHGENEQQVIAINSELLSRNQSKELAAKLGELLLQDVSYIGEVPTNQVEAPSSSRNTLQLQS